MSKSIPLGLYHSLALLSFLFCLYAAWADKLFAAMFAFLGAVLSFFWVRITDIDFSSSLIKFSAKFKEMSEVIEDAHATIEQLKRLAKINGKAIMMLTIRAGRWAGPDDRYTINLRNDIVELWDQVGLPKEEYQDAIQDWDMFIRFDYAYYIVGRHSPSIFGDYASEWKCFQDRFDDLANPARPEEIYSVLKKADMLSGSIEELIDDYKYYITHSTHRSMERWLNRDNWKKHIIERNAERYHQRQSPENPE